MQYLACASRQSESSEVWLKLLAVQTSDYTWQVIAEEDAEPMLTIDEALLPRDGHCQLVLVNLSSSDRAVKQIYDATDWVMTLVRDYLQTGVTPDFLRQESERAEQWRQSLTLQNQELSRRIMEFEARREELRDAQELLKIEQAKLAAAKDEEEPTAPGNQPVMAEAPRTAPAAATRSRGGDTEEALEELRRQLQGRAAELELWEKRLEAREAVVASMEAKFGLDDDD
ncbi:MAG: hypothetical protein MH825_06725 [Cyanobacteria bacterium]|nr:hypothetical protein [Cyanobacteriota bacterium]